MKRIYLDYAATSPTDPEVLKAMEPYFFEKFGNSTSPHTIGREAQKAVEDARQSLARLLNAQPQEIVFTSGATESNNFAIFGVARALRSRGNHIIVSSIEHHSVLEPIRALSQEGFEITYLPVNSFGRVDPQEVARAITPKTILTAVMMANNEIGTIEPAAEIGTITRERKIPFLVDAVQAVGRMPVNVNQLNCDLLSLSAHKFYGPKGVGALYIRKDTAIEPFLLGGDQERNRRASTQNVPGIVGLGKAVELCQNQMIVEAQRQKDLRDKMIEYVLKNIDGSRLNGHPTERLAHNAHFSFERIDGETLLTALDMEGIAASMGSACTSGALEPSHVLRAIGLSDALALESLRVTIGRWTTQQDVVFFLETLNEKIKKLRA